MRVANRSWRTRLPLLMIATAFTSMLATAPPARADFMFGGTVESWEWVTDASTAIVVAEAGPKQEAVGAPYTCRVTKVLKQPKDSKLQLTDYLS